MAYMYICTYIIGYIIGYELYNYYRYFVLYHYFGSHWVPK